MSYASDLVVRRTAVGRSVQPPFYSLSILAALGLYLGIAAYRLTGIPLGYDELLFCNAALGCPDPDLFAFVKVGGLPVLLMDYIGALKAWLYYPIFKIFGVSIWSIRFPMVLLGAGSLYWLGTIVRREWGWKLAVLITYLLALDASYIHYAHFDTGPNAIELFLKVASMGCWLRFVQTKRNGYLIGVAAALLLGLFNKLNFVWYVNAFYAGLVVAYGRWAYDHLLLVKRLWLWMLFALGITYLLAVAYLLVANQAFDVFGQKVGNEKGLLEPFFRVFNLFNDVMGGSGLMVYTYWFGFGGWPSWLFAIQPIVGALLLVTSLTALVVIALRAKLIGPIPAEQRLFVFAAIVLFALLAQMFVTERARYGWHVFGVYPFATLSGVYAIRLVWSWLPGSVQVRQNASWLMLAGLLVLTVAAQGAMLRGLRRQSFQYGAAINKLIDYAQPINQKFIIVGGACTTQLLTMTQQADKYYELAYLFNVTHKFLTIRAKDHDEFARKFLTTPGEYLFIDTTNPLKRGETARFRDFYCRPFLDVVADHGAKVEVVKEILGPQDGYRIYRVVK